MHSRSNSSGHNPAEAREQSPIAPSSTPRPVDPRLAHFTAQVDQRFRRDQMESFWSLEEEFRQLAHSDFAQQFVNRELELIRQDPSHLGEWRPNQLVIHRGRGYALSIWLLESERRYIHSTSFLGMCAPIGTESLSYDVYRLPANYRNAIFDPAVRLEPAGSGITAPGGILLLQSDRFAYDFKVRQPLPVLKFASSSFQALEWLFNKDNLHAWQANDSELVWTQLRVAAYILGRLANQSSLEPLELLSTHPHHAVRWAAIQNLGRISRQAALPKLEQALSDPHPHVRRAAAKTLQPSSRK